LAQTNFDETLITRFGQVREGDGSVCAAALKSKVPVILNDIEGDSLFPTLREWMGAAGIRSIVSMPVVGAAGGCIGVCSLHYREPSGASVTTEVCVSAYRDGFKSLFLAMGHS
jgi:GAF domain-containing protein